MYFAVNENFSSEYFLAWLWMQKHSPVPTMRPIALSGGPSGGGFLAKSLSICAQLLLIGKLQSRFHHVSNQYNARSIITYPLKFLIVEAFSPVLWTMTNSDSTVMTILRSSWFCYNKKWLHLILHNMLTCKLMTALMTQRTKNLKGATKLTGVNSRQ